MARYGRLLTDAQWEKIRPWLPKRSRRPQGGPTTGQRPQSARRDFVDSAQRSSLAGFARGIPGTSNVWGALMG